jgi:tetratricopeptide (TPR) repeat protein
MHPRVARAHQLIQRSRPELAESELRAALIDLPNDAEVHALLGICLGDQKKWDEATREAQTAVGLDPENAMPHYALARVYSQRARYREAEQSIRTALQLWPESTTMWAELARILIQQSKWSEAQIAADMGLQFDPEDVDCLNYRAMALLKLRKKVDAKESIQAALQHDPDDALSHANLGWTMLEQGDPGTAITHFREALRLNPELDWARSGVVEALKARNFLYRWLLAYFLWIAKLGSQASWAVIIGAYVGFRFLGEVARNQPAWAPFIWPLLGAYFLFALSTWMASPLMNLALRLHPLGKHALSHDQKRGANLVGLCVAAAIGFAILFFVLTQPACLAAIVVAVMLIPASASIFQCEPGWPRRNMTLITLGLLALGTAAVVSGWYAFSTPDEVWQSRFGKLLTYYLLGSVASQFAANALVRAQVKK